MFAVRHATDSQGNLLIQDPPTRAVPVSEHESFGHLAGAPTLDVLCSGSRPAGTSSTTRPGWSTGTGILGYWTRALGNAPNGKPVITYDWYRTFIQFLVDSGASSGSPK